MLPGCTTWYKSLSYKAPHRDTYPPPLPRFHIVIWNRSLTRFHITMWRTTQQAPHCDVKPSLGARSRYDAPRSPGSTPCYGSALHIPHRRPHHVPHSDMKPLTYQVPHREVSKLHVPYCNDETVCRVRKIGTAQTSERVGVLHVHQQMKRFQPHLNGNWSEAQQIFCNATNVHFNKVQRQ